MWCFDPNARRQLTHSEHGTTKKLKSTDCKVLEMLFLHQGQVVTKEQLENAAWPGRFVSGSSLTQSIAQLRLALGDSGREQKIIKTTPKQGYMLHTGVLGKSSETELASDASSSQFTVQTVFERQYVPDSPASISDESSIAPPSKGISRIQGVLLAFLSFLFIITSSWLAVITYTSAKADREDWQQITFQDVRYFFEPEEQGEQLFEWLKDTYPDNLLMLYLSKNPEQTYISCVYLSSNLKDRNVINMSFTHDFSFAQIKEVIHEQCQ